MEKPDRETAAHHYRHTQSAFPLALPSAVKSPNLPVESMNASPQRGCPCGSQRPVPSGREGSVTGSFSQTAVSLGS